MSAKQADLAIVGGGIAGLWTLRRVVAAGYNAVLFEAEALGGGQTIASQGMIHGGIKYALGGVLTGASEAIAAMPSRWHACIEGRGELDLSRLRPLSDRYYFFAGTGSIDRLTSFFASSAMRGRIQSVKPKNYPPAFAGQKVSLYETADLVLDIPELIDVLLDGVADRVYQLPLDANNVSPSSDGFTIAGEFGELNVRHLVNCSGTGAEALLHALNERGFAMQRRPLKQVIVECDLPHPIFAHCLTGIRKPEPRLTLTTHQREGRTFLYIGGRLATEGVNLSNDEQIDKARKELDVCLPWLNFADATFKTLTIDRAEPRQVSALRPDEAFVDSNQRLVQAWPTKLSLAPDLADRVMACLSPPASVDERPDLALPRPPISEPLW